MNFSDSEIKILLNIVKKDIQLEQSGGSSSNNLSDDELLVIGKMKLKYGDDYVNQLNIIKNKLFFVKFPIHSPLPKTINLAVLQLTR